MWATNTELPRSPWKGKLIAYRPWNSIRTKLFPNSNSILMCNSSFDSLNNPWGRTMPSYNPGFPSCSEYALYWFFAIVYGWIEHFPRSNESRTTLSLHHSWALILYISREFALTTSPNLGIAWVAVRTRAADSSFYNQHLRWNGSSISIGCAGQGRSSNKYVWNPGCLWMEFKAVL